MRKLAREAVIFALLGMLLAIVGACSSSLNPEKKILGKWQSHDFTPAPKVHRDRELVQMRFEFLEDGSVVRSRKYSAYRGLSGYRPAAWEQQTGTYHLIDPTRLKLDFGWANAWGPGTGTIYEVDWQGNDHITLRLPNTAVEFERQQQWSWDDNKP